MLTLDLVKRGKLTILGPGYSYRYSCPDRKDILRVKVEFPDASWEGNYHKTIYDMWVALKTGPILEDEFLKRLIDNFNEYGEYMYSEGDDNGYMSSLGEEL
jgi:hypothetical protein